MQRAYLVINKDTQIAGYLTQRSILDVVDERRSLTDLDLNNMPIVDVERLIIIFYDLADGGLSFRAEMNALRNLLSSAFFNADTMTVILVNIEDPMTEDIINSAIRDSKLSHGNLEVIHHDGTLMFSDVGNYLAGAAIGQQSSSTFKSVYIREADKEEKDRFENVPGENSIDTLLPALTDMSALYKQRAHVEAISAGRVVMDTASRPETVNEFTRIDVISTKTYPTFVVSGEDFTMFERAAGYLVDYERGIGRRVLVINTDYTVNIAEAVGECVELNLEGLKMQSTPTNAVAVLSVRFNQLGYVIQYMNNILGIEEVIFNVAEEDYVQMCKFVRQLSDEVYCVYVAHFHKRSVDRFIAKAIPATALFLTFEIFQEDFGLKSRKKELKRCVVGKFPVEDVDTVEFRDLSTGAKGDEDSGDSDSE